MVDIIDLCEDEDGREVSNRRQRDQSCHQSQLSAPKTVLPTLRIQLEPKLDHCNTIARDLPLPASGPGVSQSRAYPESFYVDFITMIEHAFPWQTFALRHRISANDLRHIFFVLVTLPLSDPDDNSKRLKVAHGAQKRFSEWRRAWEEAVAKTSTSSSECKDTTEWEGSFGNM
jgi:hypothetical protein